MKEARTRQCFIIFDLELCGMVVDLCEGTSTQCEIRSMASLAVECCGLSVVMRLIACAAVTMGISRNCLRTSKSASPHD